MTRDDIIRLAREAGWNGIYSKPILSISMQEEDFLRFAKLIEQHLYYDGVHTCHDECQRPSCVRVREAIQAEREACAKVCDFVAKEIDDTNGTATYIGKAIRARGEK